MILSDAAAESLSNYSGEIHNWMISELSENAAKAFAKKTPDSLNLGYELEEQIAAYR